MMLRPAAGGQHGVAEVRYLLTDTTASAIAVVDVKDVGRQVHSVATSAPVQPNDGDACLPQPLEQRIDPGNKAAPPLTSTSLPANQPCS